MTPDQSFSRNFRLSSAEDFSGVFRVGRRQRGEFFNLLVRKAPEREQVRFGIAVGRKLGTPAKRNRYKRLVRELLRREGKTLAGMDVIVEVLPPAKAAARGALVADLSALLKRVGTSRA